MFKRFFRLSFLGFFALLVSLPMFAHAAIEGVVVGQTASLYRQTNKPYGKFLNLQRGHRVVILGKRSPSWFLVQAKVRGRTYKGWVPSKVIKPIRKPRTNTWNNQSKQYQQDSSLDGFFDGGKSRQTSRKGRTRDRSRSSSGERKIKFLGSASVGYMMHSYALNSSGVSAFRYNIGGLALRLGAGVDGLSIMQDKMRLGFRFGYDFGMLNSQTDLKDANGVLFDTSTKKNKASNLYFEILGWLPLGVDYEDSIKLAPLLGYQIFKFKADDIKDAQGNPISLYVTQDTKSLYLGFMLQAPIANFQVDFGAKALLLNQFSESPANVTGVNGKAGIGFVVPLKVAMPVLEFGMAHFGYQLMLQSQEFEGPAQRIEATPNINDGDATITYHLIDLGMTFTF